MPGIHRAALAVARLMAIAGGIVLSVLILIVCISIAGRALNSFPHADLVTSVAPSASAWLLGLGIGAIPGDFEIVEAGMAFCIFAFLPYCQVTAGHASVDVFTAFLPTRANRLLSVAIEILFAVVLVVIAWQLKEGMDSKLRSGQTSLLLQFPVWWGYALSLVGAAAAALAAVHMALVRVHELLTGRTVLEGQGGADH